MGTNEKLGEGMKFTVYRDSDNRVKKIPKTPKEVKCSCLKQDLLGTFLLEGGIDNYSKRLVQDRKESIKEIKNRLDNSENLYRLLGRPEFENGFIYQDECETFGDRLRKNPGEYEEILEDAVQLMKECWKYGFIDSAYNFTVNFGYDGEDNPIVMDFDELSFSKDEIICQIEDESWKSQRSHLWELSLISVVSFLKNPSSGYRDMKKAYASRMEEEVTLSAFEDLWQSEIS